MPNLTEKLTSVFFAMLNAFLYFILFSFNADAAPFLSIESLNIAQEQ